jgi:protein tyrosine/serine phosphatase
MGPEWRSKVKVPWLLRGVFCLLLWALLFVAPFLYYRYGYTYAKRLRIVDSGLVYRSGCMTAPGFREALTTLKIRTVLNLQDEAPDPALAEGYFTSDSILESQLCKEMNVNYVFLCLDLVDRKKTETDRPAAIEQFLALMDNPDNYPVLIHCRAGLHRTGCLVALYRMEYDHWSMEKALNELKANGFGEYVSTKANDYIAQYVVNYQPGIRKPVWVKVHGGIGP